jgi:hypothetical protein
MDFPEPFAPHRHISLGMRPYRDGGFASNSWGSAVWPAANRAMYTAFSLPTPFLLKRFFVVNGGAVSGNFDIGLFAFDGAKLRSSGSTAQSGVSSVQYVTPTEMLVPPGAYYLGLSVDNTTAQFMRATNAVADGRENDGQVQEASALPLPATMTPAAIAASYIPFIGITSTSTGF